MSEVMDSLVTDEFEIIEGTDDDTNENESWTMQKTIRFDQLSINLPSNYVFSTNENQDLNKEKSTLSPETPILFDSVAAAEANAEKLEEVNQDDKTPVVTMVNDTLHEMSIIAASESSTSQPESLIDISLEDAENALKNSILYVGELKKRLDSQASQIVELQNSDKSEVEKLLKEQKEEFEKKLEGFETLKKEELDEINSGFSLKIRESDAIIEELKTQLAATSQCAQIWKENAEKQSSYRDEKTIVDRLTEENKMLREKLDHEVARRIEQSELRKMFENQAKENAIDVPVSIIAKQLADKNTYALQLEKELMKLREELKNTQKTLDVIKEESTNHEQIVQVLREDQVESTRVLADRESHIKELERICSRLSGSDDFGSM